MKITNRPGTTLLALLLVSPVHAQLTPNPPPAARPVTGPGLQDSLRLAQAILAACATKGFPVSVSVVDSAGQAKVSLAADSSPGRTLTAVRKAATAVAFRLAGSQLTRRVADDRELAKQLATNPEYNAHAGSLPLWSNGQLLGAVGVTGAPSHEDDEACARAGVAQSPYQSL